MIIDYIARTNNMSYNIKLAKLFGIYSSAFINLLLDLHFSKPKDEEYIKLSREDIYNLSGMDEEKQKEVVVLNVENVETMENVLQIIQNKEC